MKGHVCFLLVLGTVAAASIETTPTTTDGPDLTASTPGAESTVKEAQSTRNSRSFKVPEIFSTIGSFFGGGEEVDIPHLGHQPLWKVHKYHGISLQPVHLPEPEIPAEHPIPPTHHGEPPSIVNVPEPYGHDDFVPPANEYGPPPAHYPPPEPHSAPYPSAPAGPYPPAPSGPYPPAPSGPYPAPSGPHPPHSPHPIVYNAHLSHDEPRGPVTDDLSSNFLDLQSMLPPEVYEHMQQYISTPEGGSRLSALFGIMQNAQKLKANAALSLKGIFQKFLGGAGGSANIAIDSGTYTDVPHDYPAPQGILNNIRLIGSGISGSPLPSLPDAPPLPVIPGLKHLPHVPGLPHIHLPDSSHHIAKNTIGKYVSFSIPEHHEEHAPYIVPEEHPIPYHAPEPAPAPAAPYPAPPPAGPYPAPAPAGPYPAPAPVGQYAPAPEIPSTSYGTPEGPSFTYPQRDSSGHYSEPQPSFERPSDSSPANSEKNEQTREQVNESDKKEEVSKMPVLPLKTTKLQRIPGSYYRNHRLSAQDRDSDINNSLEDEDDQQ